MRQEHFMQPFGRMSHTVAYQNIPILSDIFGSKPQIAPYVPTDYTQEQLLALQENIGAFPDITQLGNLYEQYMLNQFSAAGFPLESLVQGGVGLTQQEMGQARQELAGQIPADVQAQVQRSSAYQSLLAGTGGSPMSRALTARDLGLTSLDLINQGANLTGQAGNAAQQWQAIAGQATMNPASMFVTPQQRAALDMQNRLYQQATQQLRYNVAAAPNPIAKGLSDIVENLTAAYLGGKVGSIGAGNAAAEQAAYGGGAAQANQMAAMDLSQGVGGVDTTGLPPGAGFQPGAISGGAGSVGAGSDWGSGGTGYPVPGIASAPTQAGFAYGVGYPAADPYAAYGGGSGNYGLNLAGSNPFAVGGYNVGGQSYFNL